MNKKKEHKHKYNNTGGGTILLGSVRLPSDADFECRCGKGFRIQTTVERYFNLPESYRSVPKTLKDMKVKRVDWKKERAERAQWE